MHKKKIHPIDRQLSELITTIKTLRGEDGCPWDQKQTPQTMIKYLREETEELIEGITNNHHQNICEEIGDVLYLLLMISEYQSENTTHTISESVQLINDKLIRRHPHVFGDSEITDEQQLKDQWEAIKREEKQKL